MLTEEKIALINSEAEKAGVPLRVGPSTIPGAGRGLFTTAPIPADAAITEYGGAMITAGAAACLRGPDRDYLYEFPEALVAVEMRGDVAATRSLVNRMRWDGTFLDPRANFDLKDMGRWINSNPGGRNAYATYAGRRSDGAWRLAFCAMRDLAAGEEVLTDYGPYHAF